MSGYKTLPLFLLLLLAPLALAAESGGVTVGGTRLIYDGSKKEAALSVANSDTNPYLIQSWLEPETEGQAKPPFIITPPLFRLDGNQQNLLRIVHTGNALPTDRESLYWINVKAIPANTTQDGANTLQIAVRTRIKLIYRPPALKGVPEEVTQMLRWSQSGNKLTVNNPTPFYMNFSEVTLDGHSVADATYVAPMSTATFDAPRNAAGPVSWKLISDYGGIGENHTAGR